MNVLILGANSDIAKATASILAAQGAQLQLASRDQQAIERLTADLNIRYQVNTQSYFFDALDLASHQTFYDQLRDKPDVVIIAFGYLGDQKKAQQDFTEAQCIINTNYLSAVHILEIIAADFSKRGSGTIVGISSVAGRRGRKKNYFYGSAKAAFTTYLSGLRNRLAGDNIHVLTVIPGFVATKMLPQASNGLFTAQPTEVASQIAQAIESKKEVIYCKKRWQLLMWIICLLPEKIFKKTSF